MILFERLFPFIFAHLYTIVSTPFVTYVIIFSGIVYVAWKNLQWIQAKKGKKKSSFLRFGLMALEVFLVLSRSHLE